MCRSACVTRTNAYRGVRSVGRERSGIPAMPRATTAPRVFNVGRGWRSLARAIRNLVCCAAVGEAAPCGSADSRARELFERRLERIASVIDRLVHRAADDGVVNDNDCGSNDDDGSTYNHDVLDYLDAAPNDNHRAPYDDDPFRSAAHDCSANTDRKPDGR